MSTPVPLPALGESVTEGTISRWLKEVGDTVEVDEPLVEVSTDKVDTEVPSPVAGVVLEIKAAEDDTIEVGAVMAIIGEPDEAGGGSDESDDDDADDEAATDDSGTAEADTEEPAAVPAEESAPAEAPSTDTEEPAAKPTADTGASAASGTEVTLPALGESVTEGTVSRWLKEVGDTVEVDEALLEVSTDKVDTEVPSPVAGTVLEIRVAEDETVEVGGVLAIVGSADQAPAQSEPEPEQPEAAPEPADEKPEPKDEAPEPESAPEDEDPEPESAPKAEAAKAEPKDEAPQAEAPASNSDVYVTPLVRKIATENGVDLSTVTGTGIGGRIRKQDVLAAAEAAKAPAAAAPAPAAAAPAPAAASAGSVQAPAPSSQRGTTEKLSRLRKIIAARMTESLQTAAQLTATVEVDLTNISRLRAQVKDDFKKREGASLSYLPFITKVVVEVLKAMPTLNATIDTEAGTVTFPAEENIGIAVDTEKGLLVPVIKGAGDLSVAGLARKIGDLGNRTRTNKVGPDELSGGTFTITNYGSAGTLMDTPIINVPEVAILGTGALVKRPMVINHPELGQTIAIRDMMYLSLTYDHRLVDGALAARFLSAVKERLEGGDFGAEFGL
ncbi:2-oxoglutarate dehydrogenase, E2 component, dihydrolipoamide succinyltransferase [Parenemella sanctibonifatiensis]|uniref:Dihydrolipoamide acetyltransferase component of pyruvate dehydrogenase complex n=1 Tax=Parenemella sanctibonifatiensis TaxID=2016505 RepID=A0A255EE09_9ACTN|nr:2-oxoglutarate dehydrogenase, E2 component, dihydrolipoamide succinyltransferase [Parenemella sanctibonifatiensis]OYN89769.1 2-oxoglutarate dehydrogenase, E2 component, dihydrolipoamide succinyltransferase [Parenemella sanctibonifatiensis]